MIPISRLRITAESLMVVEIRRAAEKSIRPAIEIAARLAMFSMLKI
jgi:hypothetical protein